jgi:hypothetical protein
MRHGGKAGKKQRGNNMCVNKKKKYKQATYHGADRVMERLGVQKGICEATISNAWRKGTPMTEMNGLLKRFVASKMKNQPWRHIRLYKGYIYIFTEGGALLTAYELPEKTRQMLDREKAYEREIGMGLGTYPLLFWADVFWVPFNAKVTEEMVRGVEDPVRQLEACGLIGEDDASVLVQVYKGGNNRLKRTEGYRTAIGKARAAQASLPALLDGGEPVGAAVLGKAQGCAI